MLEDVRRDVRRLVEAGMGALSPARATELARSLTGGEGMEQANRLAQDLLEWSARGRERMTELVQREVKRQLLALGIATREDLDALRKRVRELEKAGGSASSAKRSSAPGGRAKKAAGKPAADTATSSSDDSS